MVGSTLAYWTAAGTAENKMTTGTVKGTIVETYTPVRNVSPGDEISRIVNVRNTGSKEMPLLTQTEP